MASKTRVICRSESRELIDLPSMIEALRAGLRDAARESWRRERVPFDVDGGSFHLVAGPVRTAQGPRFVVKLNGWFAPGVNGAVSLCDAADGSVLAFMDAAVLTQVRTAAMAGVVNGHLVLPAGGLETSPAADSSSPQPRT
jgi:ornithine cyclodeaminase/alanine dehydrogenase-like protein (mu-crystallin family)